MNISKKNPSFHQPGSKALLSQVNQHAQTYDTRKDVNDGKAIFRSARFVAKKMDQKKFIETQLRESQRQVSDLRESHISEFSNLKENISEIKETPMTKSLFEQNNKSNFYNEPTNEEMISKNIFFHMELMNVHFEDKDKGPRFGPDGQVLRHSILGKREWFMRQHTKSVTAREEDDKRSLISHPEEIKSNQGRPKQSHPLSGRSERPLHSQLIRKLTFGKTFNMSKEEWTGGVL